MKIELKRIQFSERMSEETNCFVADLYINGKNVGEAKNEGCGGPTNYYGNSKESNDIIRECEKYCSSLPDVDLGNNLKIKNSLEWAIDELFESYLKEKENKRREKVMEKGIMFGVPNGASYQYIHWKGRTLKQIPVPSLQKAVDDIRQKYCKNGVEILNTNLAELGVI
jgi:hypothetical protein